MELIKRRKLGVREFHRVFNETRSEAAQRITIGLMGDREESERFLDLFGRTAKSAFRYVDDGVDDSELDLLIFVASSVKTVSPDLQQRIKEIQLAGVDALAMIDAMELSEAAIKAKKVEAEIALDLSPSRVLFFRSAMSVSEKDEIAHKILEFVSEKSIVLAALVPEFRAKVVTNIVNGIANENAFIGVTAFFPGADLPILTVNQIRMVLRISAAYGIEMTMARARELFFVVGGGFAFRALARQAVGLVPIAGWAVKGAIAYSGTRTMGALAALHFDRLSHD